MVLQWCAIDANKIKSVVPSPLPEKVQVNGREVNIVRQLTARLVLMEYKAFWPHDEASASIRSIYFDSNRESTR